MKKLRDTGFGKFLNKVKDKIPDIGMTVLNIASNPNPINAVRQVAGLLRGSDHPEAGGLLEELDKNQAEFELECYRIDAEDRASARDREIEMAKAGKKNWIQPALAIVGVLGFFGAIAILVYGPDIQGFKRDALLLLLGTLAGFATQIYSYFFGSSSGSKQKTRMMSGNK